MTARDRLKQYIEQDVSICEVHVSFTCADLGTPIRRNEFMEDSPTAGFGGDVDGIPWGDDVVEKNRIVRRQLPVLQEQDPNYVSSMPLEERKVGP